MVIEKLQYFYGIMDYMLAIFDFFMARNFFKYILDPLDPLFYSLPKRLGFKIKRKVNVSNLDLYLSSYPATRSFSMLIMAPTTIIFYIIFGLLLHFISDAKICALIAGIIWGIIGFMFSEKVSCHGNEREKFCNKCSRKDVKWHIKWGMITLTYAIFSFFYVVFFGLYLFFSIAR